MTDPGATRSPFLRIAGGLTVVVLVVLGALSISRIREERRRVGEILDLRATVQAARVSVDSCRNELAYNEAIFRRFDTLVADLRSRVADFEAMDERGVPGERYDEYLEAFDGYNDSVLAWEARADSLRLMDASCRDLVVRHNTLADSLRRRLLREAAERR